jgi:16S rRNA (cytosine1402-N4)-methyltransferase
MDQDQDEIDNAGPVLARFEATTHLLHGNFVEMPGFLSRLNIPQVGGILLDLGIALHHIESSGRGFSFRKEEPLDMRMDTRTDVTAHNLINTLGENELRDLFRRYGEEHWAGPVARCIVREKKHRPIVSSRQLAEIVCRAVPKARWKPGFHPATRIFMALRIAVNRELEKLEEFLDTAIGYLKPGGRICVLSFHSLEDRIVKHKFRRLENPCTCPPGLPRCACGNEPRAKVLTKKALRPSAAEIADNPMARSTKMRVAQRL